MQTLNVLVACEESGAVRDAFRALGHNAWSCDLKPCDPASKYSAYHVQGGAVRVVSTPWQFDELKVDRAGPWWDLLIAHPPCTYLCNSGVRWLWNTYSWTNAPRPEDIGGKVFNERRGAKMKEAAQFFVKLWNAKVPHIAIENPIMHKYGRAEIARPLHPKYSAPDQIVQPWMFGHPETKATCLWLRGLPKLVPTKNVKEEMDALPAAQRNRIHRLPPSANRAALRSKTFPGIALAMATQWSEHILSL